MNKNKKGIFFTSPNASNWLIPLDWMSIKDPPFSRKYINVLLSFITSGILFDIENLNVWSFNAGKVDKNPNLELLCVFATQNIYNPGEVFIFLSWSKLIKVMLCFYFDFRLSDKLVGKAFVCQDKLSLSPSSHSPMMVMMVVTMVIIMTLMIMIIMMATVMLIEINLSLLPTPSWPIPTNNKLQNVWSSSAPDLC